MTLPMARIPSPAAPVWAITGGDEVGDLVLGELSGR